ncbi:unnamed protein product [Blepharisma stoltei]|uniref:Uncharacterized protein n=1 Tax=Blepharisma stoltei TaxID=1481888 RepID=A0AAU9I9U6_9CILI|nr:unnamed protein product [Blepharisma stoltei]
MWHFEYFTFIFLFFIGSHSISQRIMGPTNPALLSSKIPNPGCTSDNCDLDKNFDNEASLESENSSYFKFFDVFLQDAQNPLERDESEIPSSIDEHGDDYNDGDLLFVLATTFIDGESGTGKIWVIPTDEEDKENSYSLIVGLERPTGLCLDVNHNFLYVVDNGDDIEGYIYQYEVLWSDDDYMILDRNVYVVIYQGKTPYDCKIDQYGNMYFLNSETDEISMISYLDLYSGFTNMNYTIYQADENNNKINSPVALEVIDSEYIYFVNNADGDTAGTLNKAKTTTESVNEETIESLVYNKYPAWGVAYTDDNRIFFSLDTGEIWSVDTQDTTKLYEKTIEPMNNPRGMCHGDGKVYVADQELGEIVMFNTNDEKEDPKSFVKIQGVYMTFCVNSAYGLIVSLFIISLI